jgi:hypothetical protein
MILALYASLLFAAAAQDPSVSPEFAQPEAPQEQSADVYAEEPVDAQNGDPMQDPYQAEEPAEQPVEPVPPAEPVDTAEAEEEPEQPMVCRRQTAFNEFGRQTSRKVCRPRDEW